MKNSIALTILMIFCVSAHGSDTRKDYLCTSSFQGQEIKSHIGRSLHKYGNGDVHIHTRFTFNYDAVKTLGEIFKIDTLNFIRNFDSIPQAVDMNTTRLPDPEIAHVVATDPQSQYVYVSVVMSGLEIEVEINDKGTREHFSGECTLIK